MTKHHDHDRQQFDAQLQEARQALATSPPGGGAAAGLSLKGFWTFLAQAVTDPAVRDALWSLWQQLHPPQPPAPPPEPAS